MYEQLEPYGSDFNDLQKTLADPSGAPRVDAIRAALDAIEATRHNGLNSVDADLQFHISVARATGNRYFVDILTQMGSALIPRNRLDSAGIARAEPDAYLSLVNLEHDSILEAITRHDAEGARAAMRMHLSNSRERLRRANEAAEANS